MAWFGSLNLAYKYAIVFGTALLLTLIAGFTKVLLDRRKMNKLMRQADHEKQSGASSADDAFLNMREKDEGDLFGIRAIEAGYYGGVAQSAPNSPAASRRGSRANSPAPSIRIPYGSSNPTSSTPQILINQHYNNHAGNTMSASSSVLDLAHYRDSVGQASVTSGQSLRHSRSSPSLLDQQQSVDSVFSVLAPTAYTPSSLSPLRQPVSAKLRPSQAEMTGRHNHTSIYSANGPPSPTSGQECPYHGSPQAQERSSSGPALPLQTPNRTSTMSLQSSVFPFPEEWEESIYGEPARLVDGPEKKGKKTIEVGSLDNPSIDETSQRGSVISRVTSTSSVGQPSQPKKQSPPPVPAVPAVPLRLPLFQKNVVIGASNPEFDRFRKQRLHIEPQEDDKLIEQEVEIKSAASTTFSDPETPTTPTAKKKRNHLSVVSPRTSFSFEYANSESTHPEQRAFTAQPAPRILTRQPYSKGTYTPAGR